MFSGKGSAAKTLQGYFRECSRGRAVIDRTNSAVVGTVPIPCEQRARGSGDGHADGGDNSTEGGGAGGGASLVFRTDRCLYSDSTGWHQYAQA
eukprot:364473-Chlamydomonas_euryale.AAC.6